MNIPENGVFFLLSLPVKKEPDCCSNPTLSLCPIHLNRYFKQFPRASFLIWFFLANHFDHFTR